MPLLDSTGEPPTCDLATQEDVAIDRAHAAVDDDGNKEDGEEELDKLPTVDDAELELPNELDPDDSLLLLSLAEAADDAGAIGEASRQALR